MDASGVAALIVAAVAVFGTIGGVVRWAAIKFEEQAKKLDALEKEHVALQREYSLVLVRLERFRLAFQMVAAELHRRDAGNVALIHAKALLDEAFKIDPDIPEDMKAELDKLR